MLYSSVKTIELSSTLLTGIPLAVRPVVVKSPLVYLPCVTRGTLHPIRPTQFPYHRIAFGIIHQLPEMQKHSSS
jgi:hypothetical protein